MGGAERLAARKEHGGRTRIGSGGEQRPQVFLGELGDQQELGPPIDRGIGVFLYDEQVILHPEQQRVRGRQHANRNAPKAYLDAINREIARGRTTMLYQNDEAFLPALKRLGIREEDAREYYLLDCWEPVIKGGTNEHCDYVILLKILELSVYGDFNRDEIELKFESFENVQTFEEFYARYLRNLTATLQTRAAIASDGRRYWQDVDPHKIYSAALEDCLENHRDLTAGGARYSVDELVCAGFPNVVDSLLAIRELCFERKQVTLDAYLDTVKSNWEGQEELRRTALRCRFFGDESQESGALAARLHDDLYAISQKLPSAWNGRISIGYMLFMEMPVWAARMRATPDGRRDGKFFAHSLTPSRLHSISAVTSVFYALWALDMSKAAANSVVNLTMPFGKLDLDRWEAFLCAAAQSPVQAL